MERKVLLICAGGMSTGILMRKMEKYAEEQGISLKIEAVGMSAYEDVYKNYDVILLGPQVSYKKGEIEQNTQKPIAVIPAYDYAIGNVANIMKQVSSPTQTAVTSTCATRGSSDTATGVNSDQVSLSREPS